MKFKEANVGGCVADVKINRELLAAEMALDPKDSRIDRVSDVFQVANRVQKSKPDPLTFSKTSKNLESLQLRLKQVNRLLDEMDANDEHLLDQSYWLANNSDRLMMDVSCDESVACLGGSAFALIADRMEKAAIYMQSFLHNQGRTDHTYTEALSVLASGFKEIFPEREVTAKTETPFHKVVVFWLNYVAGYEVADATRLIKNMIEVKKDS